MSSQSTYQRLLVDAEWLHRVLKGTAGAEIVAVRRKNFEVLLASLQASIAELAPPSQTGSQVTVTVPDHPSVPSNGQVTVSPG